MIEVQVLEFSTLLLLLYYTGYHKTSYYLISKEGKFRTNPVKSQKFTKKFLGPVSRATLG